METVNPHLLIQQYLIAIGIWALTLDVGESGVTLLPEKIMHNAQKRECCSNALKSQ